MQVCLVFLDAEPVLADVGVFAPAAAAQLGFFAEGPTDGASFQQVSHNVPGVASPSFQDFPFFPNLLEFLMAEHNLVPRFSLFGCNLGTPDDLVYSLLPVGHRSVEPRTALTHPQLSGLENSDNGPLVEWEWDK
jgi:hypothetical protein